MADITLSTFVNGVPSDPSTVESNFYAPTAAGTASLEAINGHLDNANREAGWDISRSHIQQGAQSRGQAVGGNINMDYFGDVFNGWTLTEDASSPAEADKFYQVIPGAAITYYLPFSPTLVVLSWSVLVASRYDKQGIASDTDFETTASRIRLFVNGSRQANKEFPIPAKGLGNSAGLDGNWDRTWSGFLLINNPAAGWHSASLRIVSFPETNGTVASITARPNNQARVRVRHMDYVYFR